MQSAINSTDIEALWYVIAFHIVLYPKGLNLTSFLLNILWCFICFRYCQVYHSKQYNWKINQSYPLVKVKVV